MNMMNKFLWVAAAGLALASGPALARTYTVHMVADPNPGVEKPYRFEPDQLTVIPGDQVVFINDDVSAHDVMFDSVPDGADEAMSPMLSKQGDKWRYTFQKTGTYHYHCHPHESVGMEGEVTVIPAARSKPVSFNANKPGSAGDH